MADVLTFYTHPMSRGRIVRWMLEEVGEPYETRCLEYGATMKGDEYRAVNPMGKVPALKHGDVVITECAAICAYLADAFPKAGLAPAAHDKARAPYYRWLFFAAGPLEAALTNKSMGFHVPDELRSRSGYGSMEAVIDTLEMAVASGPYLAGGRFSAADVYVGSHIGWGMAFGNIEKRPAFETYVAALMARPAAVRARAIDDKLLAERASRGP